MTNLASILKSRYIDLLIKTHIVKAMVFPVVKLGMEVYGYDPYISVNSAWALSKWVKHVTNLNELLSECDYMGLYQQIYVSTF